MNTLQQCPCTYRPDADVHSNAQNSSMLMQKDSGLVPPHYDRPNDRAHLFDTPRTEPPTGAWGRSAKPGSIILFKASSADWRGPDDRSDGNTSRDRNHVIDNTVEMMSGLNILIFVAVLGLAVFVYFWI
jgi:hypothetical protein